MARASFLSILALKPPLAHSWAAPLPPIIPLLMRVRPAMAAAIAPTPKIIGVAILGRTQEGSESGELSERKKPVMRHVDTDSRFSELVIVCCDRGPTEVSL